MQQMTEPRLKPWTSRACAPGTGTNSQARPAATSVRTAAPSPTCRRLPSCPRTSGSFPSDCPAPDEAAQHRAPGGPGLRCPAGGICHHRPRRCRACTSCLLQHAQHPGWGRGGSPAPCCCLDFPDYSAGSHPLPCCAVSVLCSRADPNTGCVQCRPDTVVRAVKLCGSLCCVCASHTPGEATCTSAGTGSGWARPG